MKTSEEGIKLIKHFEGIKNRPYKCSARVWTIGVGHVIYDDQLRLKLAERDSFKLKPEDDRIWSNEEIDDLLKRDLSRFEAGVCRMLRPVSLKQHEFDALVSFAFNLGLGTLQRSTVRSAMLRGDKETAGETLLKYCRAGGKVLKGLQRRRLAEHALLMRG
jgi:lysozyme